MGRNAGVLGAAWRELVEQVPELFIQTAHDLETLVGQGLRPLVGSVYDLPDGARALQATRHAAEPARSCSTSVPLLTHRRS